MKQFADMFGYHSAMFDYLFFPKDVAKFDTVEKILKLTTELRVHKKVETIVIDSYSHILNSKSNIDESSIVNDLNLLRDYAIGNDMLIILSVPQTNEIDVNNKAESPTLNNCIGSHKIGEIADYSLGIEINKDFKGVANFEVLKLRLGDINGINGAKFCLRYDNLHHLYYSNEKSEMAMGELNRNDGDKVYTDKECSNETDLETLYAQEIEYRNKCLDIKQSDEDLNYFNQLKYLMSH